MNKIDLSGKWQLKLDSEKKGIQNEYYKLESFEDIINLPGSLSEQKKSPETDERATGYLTDPYKYEGYAWYKKIIDFTKEENKSIKGGNYRLILERTRYSTLWINGRKIGSNNSINGIQKYDFELSPKDLENKLDITLLISNVDYIVPGGHMTSPDTQTNWNGITGRIELIELDSVRLESIKIKTLVDNEIKLIISANLIATEAADYTFKIPDLFEKSQKLIPGKNQITFTMPGNTKLWSDTNPNLYNLEISNNTKPEKYSFSIGFRTFKAVGKYFENNGKRIFLRGKHDGMIFPLTGYAPTDLDSWLKVMKTAKNYGINHYRFHTSCPPQAAFTAADQLGIYMSPELPFWGTIQAPGEEGFDQKSQDYLISEGYKILDDFGNHPSFVMMSMGNELWGSEDRLDSIMKNYHDYDDRHLYTGGSNNFQFWPRTSKHEDYFVGVRFSKEALIRGSYAQCDAPLGFIQTQEPNTNHNYDVFFEDASHKDSKLCEDKEIEIQYGTGVKKVKTSGQNQHFLPNKPCISHEVGQYCIYPDFSEIEKYTGVLKAFNLEIFKERLEKSGMLDKAEDFFRDSGRLAIQCYKNEIEAALRSNELSGFQLLDIQDFTGQGTALVGVLNSFMESKGLVTGPQWRSFCDKTVLLASFEKYLYQNGDELKAEIILHNYSDQNYLGNCITVYIIDNENDEILYEEDFEIKSNQRGNTNLGTFTFRFDNIEKYKKVTLLLIMNLEDSNHEDSKYPDKNQEVKSILNSYTLHVYPAADKEIKKLIESLQEKDSIEYNNCLLTKSYEEAKKLSLENKKVIYFKNSFENEEIVKGTYCTDFWCYPMFRSISESMKKEVPVGTLGLTINTSSELLEEFPSESYTNPKWYNIVEHSTCLNLAGKNINPDIQMIDNFERNWKLGLLWKEDNIIVTTCRLWEIADKPEAAAFLKSLINSN